MRIALWGVRVAGAFAAGWVMRMLRRILRQPPRIWHGSVPMFFTRALVEADRHAGFPSRSVVQHTRLGGYALVRPEDFDVVHSAADEWGGNDSHWRCMIDLLCRGDIWFAFFDAVFFPASQAWKNALAMRLIRLAGIRIVVSAHGGDVVYLDDSIRTRYDWLERMQLDYPDWDLRAAKEDVVARTTLFCRNARLVISDSYMQPFLPCAALDFPFVTVDTRELRPGPPPGNERPVIVHAPNHRNVKGTDLLLAALERLRARGFAADLRLVEKMPRHEALQVYATSDIIADQFLIGSFGALACEGMALGKPVITHLDETHVRNPIYAHPLVNGIPENLLRVLAALIELPALRERLGAAGRASVERYQSSAPVGELLGRVYDHVWWGRPLDFESATMFEPARPRRPYSEEPADEEFWPVNVSDLIGDIRAAIARSR